MRVLTRDFEGVYDGLIKHLIQPGKPVTLEHVKAVIKQESLFNPIAKSHCGARGLMQLMPKTDKWLDGEIDGFDVYGNVKDGIKYLNMLYKYWTRHTIPEGKNRWSFVFGSYNAGQGNIRKVQAKCRLKNVDDTNWSNIAFNLETVTGPANARQTVDYVDKVLANYYRYVNAHRLKLV